MKKYCQFIKKFSPLIFIIALLISSFYFHLYSYLTLSTIHSSQEIIQSWTNEHYILSVGIYIFLFTLLIACTMPCATILNLLGGLLFGGVAVFYAVFSTALGGALLFFAVKSAFGTYLMDKSSGWLKKMELGFQHNAFNYLLTFRLIPFFPCWISNVSAAALNVPFKTFIIATVLGILPSTIICVWAGRSLDKLIATHQDLFKLLLTPSILFPLLGLALLSLLPVIYKSIKK